MLIALSHRRKQGSITYSNASEQKTSYGAVKNRLVSKGRFAFNLSSGSTTEGYKLTLHRL